MTHKSGHVIIDIAEKSIAKTPFKVRDLIALGLGLASGFYFF